MSAFAYINIEDVPADLRETAAVRADDITGATLVAYDGCPLVGESRKAADPEPRAVVEYPFPRNTQIRNDLVSWFVDKGINFTVVM
ncbi:MAG TPA: hypothetical protein VGU01_02920 [Sphingomicrobium sp.]|nr:hypothetical protein [Sphingomicrobium sp.]